MGVAKPALVGVYAEAMRLLGTERAMIVAGEEGLDELSISGVSQFVSIGFDLGHTIIAPEGAGLPRHPLSAIRGGDPAGMDGGQSQRLCIGCFCRKGRSYRQVNE